MAERQSISRLQPSLLDRLTDLEPSKTSETSEQRTLSQRELRLAVVRDLESLFNTECLSSVESLAAYPWVADSILNYGVPVLSGRLIEGIDIRALEAELVRAIVAFEPRVNPKNLAVSGLLNQSQSRGTGISFEISVEIWGDPAPMHVMLKTELDLETGRVSVSDFGG